MAAQALMNLKASGLLMTAEDACERFRPIEQDTLAPTRAFIITCDRPAAVERLLETLLRHSKLSQHEALILVDDSRDPANRTANRELVANFNLSSPTDMRYVGEEAQQSLLSGLVERLPQHGDGIRFLLDRSRWESTKTFGRSRTLCLLLSVGRRALVMDDDILCRTVLPPVVEEGVGIGGGARQAVYYANEQDMFSRNKLADFDPLSGHASLLGASFGHALEQLNGGPLQQSQLLGCNAALANTIKADSPILSTQSGSMGDPGVGGAHWVLIQQEDSLKRFVEAPHGMRAATENRINWLGSPRPVFHKKPFMSQLTGMDNTQLLPPYFPAYRGEDALFGALLLAMHPHSVSLEYPWSVPHLPLETRGYSMDDPIAGRGDSSTFVRYLTEQVGRTQGGDPEENLRFLALEIRRIAACSDADLLLDFRRELAYSQAAYLNALQDQLARAERLGSEELQAYLRRGITEIQEVLSSVNSPTAMDGIPPGTTDADLVAQFRQLALGFAAALDGWAEIRVAAAALYGQMQEAGDFSPL